MSFYTTIGYFENDPHQPLLFVVKANDIIGAIHGASREAETLKTEAGGEFINTFVLAGTPEVLSTWAG